MIASYLKVSSHDAFPYDGSEERAIELEALIGKQRSHPVYITRVGIQTTEKTFTGKLAIYGRNGINYVLPDEVIMHDVESNEWYSVTQEQFYRQYRAFEFRSKTCATKAGGTGTVGDSEPDYQANSIRGHSEPLAPVEDAEA